MEHEDTDPDLEPTERPRRRRPAIWVTVALGVWASIWLLARSTAGTGNPPAAAGIATTPPPIGGGASSQTPKDLRPPTFAHAPGWNVRTSGVLAPRPSDLPMAVAANVPFARQDIAFMAANGMSESASAGTISSLPPQGVVILAVLPFPSGGGPAPPHFGDFPDRGWPLQLADARINRLWQSQSRPNAPEYDLWGRVEGTYVEVSVYFGTPQPSSGTFQAAQSELDRLVLPEVPPGTPPPGWATEDAGSVTIQTPPGWAYIANPVPHAPWRVWFAVGTWRFPPGGGSCGPETALRSLPPKGALIWVSELHPGGLLPRSFPRQPARFTLRGLAPHRYSCSSSRPSYLWQFHSDHRWFQAQIAFGPEASAATRANALQSLSSLRVGSVAG
jgi:hypothetical protein